jgi:hypothetical protein
MEDRYFIPCISYRVRKKICVMRVTTDEVCLENEFTDHLYTPFRTTSNYSPTADLHTLQITSTC